MKVSIVTNNDNNGGAARAAFRLLKSLQFISLDTNMYVRTKYTDDPSVIGPHSDLSRVISMFRSPFNKIFNKLSIRSNKNFHSNNILPSKMHKLINNNDSQVINLHWVGAETMSIKDISMIDKPIVWTLHDMWAFCGSEHYTNYDEKARWRLGYHKKNNDPRDKGFDLDRYTWNKKSRLWNKPMHIVTPSDWLASCAKESVLFRDWPISVIPNPIDTTIYRPLDKASCRQILNIPEDHIIILFGAIGGSKNVAKGFDLLLDSLNLLSLDKNIDKEKITCVIFGQSKPADSSFIPFNSIWLGHVHDDITLSLIYNSANVMIVPSRIDNFPQAATEAQACGTPVVGFNTSGVANAIIHNVTGYLADPYDTKSLMEGIIKVTLDNSISKELSSNAYQRAQEQWSQIVVAEKYNKLFQETV